MRKSAKCSGGSVRAVKVERPGTKRYAESSRVQLPRHEEFDWDAPQAQCCCGFINIQTATLLVALTTFAVSVSMVSYTVAYEMIFGRRAFTKTRRELFVIWAIFGSLLISSVVLFSGNVAKLWKLYLPYLAVGFVSQMLLLGTIIYICNRLVGRYFHPELLPKNETLLEDWVWIAGLSVFTICNWYLLDVVFRGMRYIRRTQNTPIL